MVRDELLPGPEKEVRNRFCILNIASSPLQWPMRLFRSADNKKKLLTNAQRTTVSAENVYKLSFGAHNARYIIIRTRKHVRSVRLPHFVN